MLQRRRPRPFGCGRGGVSPVAESRVEGLGHRPTLRSAAPASRSSADRTPQAATQETAVALPPGRVGAAALRSRRRPGGPTGRSGTCRWIPWGASGLSPMPVRSGATTVEVMAIVSVSTVEPRTVATTPLAALRRHTLMLAAWTVPAVAVLSVAVLALLATRVEPAAVRGLLAEMDWSWALVAAAAAAASFLGAAWNLVGFAPVEVGFRHATAAALAGTALKVVTPGSVGTVAVNARLLQRAGSSTPATVGSVAASQFVQLATSVVMLAAVALLPGRVLPAVAELPGVGWLAAGAAAAVLVALAVAVARGGLRWLLATLRGVGQPMVAVFTDPRRCLAGVGGSVLLTLALAVALAASVRAVNGSISPVDVVVVLTAAVALGSAAPTPAASAGSTS